ncbi:Heat stress transcription factor B-3 [Sesamum alatum]|uniref:Heat stress transcription factor B-3 n=1 Tax=Sesamum alatum TaxID=300844 RepID=A0AAE2C8G6_9LAMI|nr:Heat stress transcription factor B-3 [Sesamum alatum]
MESSDHQSHHEKGLVEYHVMRKAAAAAPPFLLKTYMLVEEPATDEVISWNGDGTAFVVWQPAEFARDLLPTLFKHSNFSSFVRQLNTYGFRKVATNRWEFSNDMFRKGERDRLCEIRRRKAWSTKPQPNVQLQAAQKDSSDNDDQKSSSTSSSSEFTILVDENKRLKKENGVLNSELGIMKRKCKELLDLVAIHGRKSENIDDEEEEEENNEGPKLFGVRLEVEGEMLEKKRKREISESARLILSQSCK